MADTFVDDLLSQLFRLLTPGTAEARVLSDNPRIQQNLEEIQAARAPDSPQPVTYERLKKPGTAISGGYTPVTIPEPMPSPRMRQLHQAVLQSAQDAQETVHMYERLPAGFGASAEYVPPQTGLRGVGKAHDISLVPYRLSTPEQAHKTITHELLHFLFELHSNLEERDRLPAGEQHALIDAILGKGESSPAGLTASQGVPPEEGLTPATVGRLTPQLRSRLQEFMDTMLPSISVPTGKTR